MIDNVFKFLRFSMVFWIISFNSMMMSQSASALPNGVSTLSKAERQLLNEAIAAKVIAKDLKEKLISVEGFLDSLRVNNETLSAELIRKEKELSTLRVDKKMLEENVNKANVREKKLLTGVIILLAIASVCVILIVIVTLRRFIYK